MQKSTPVPKAQIDQAERKIGAVLEDLEQQTSSEVKEVELVQVVEDDPKTGVPAVHDSIDIDVDPRPQRSGSNDSRTPELGGLLDRRRQSMRFCLSA